MSRITSHPSSIVLPRTQRERLLRLAMLALHVLRTEGLGLVIVRTARFLARAAARWRRAVITPVEITIGVNARDLILAQHGGDIPFGSRPRACVFAHFDPERLVDPYVIYALRAYLAQGCCTVFVTASEHIAGAELAKVSPYVSHIVVRKNLGHDFGSHRLGLLALGDPQCYEQLILTNDSVYGPLQELAPVFEEMGRRSLDIWGATDSWEHEHHLQSYFLVFNTGALKSPFFSAFWSSFRFVNDRQYIIHEYEIGLSIKARAAGLRLGAFCEYKAVWDAQLRSAIADNDAVLDQYLRNGALRLSNPTHYCWEALITKFQYPFIKGDLLRLNPSRNPSLPRWKTVVTTHTSYPVNLITSHMKRISSPATRHHRHAD